MHYIYKASTVESENHTRHVCMTSKLLSLFLSLLASAGKLPGVGF